jgi:hypothetical protein
VTITTVSTQPASTIVNTITLPPVTVTSVSISPPVTSVITLTVVSHCTHNAMIMLTFSDHATPSQYSLVHHHDPGRNTNDHISIACVYGAFHRHSSWIHFNPYDAITCKYSHELDTIYCNIARSDCGHHASRVDRCDHVPAASFHVRVNYLSDAIADLYSNRPNHDDCI